jgi:DNA-binding PadR family transcriptional regulator
VALKHAVLAALLDGEATGYELAKRFDVATADYWSASPQQLYSELDRLSSQGLVLGELVEQQGRPNKRVFQLTDAGREELRAFTARPTRPIAIRDELLVKLRAVDSGKPESAAAAVRERLEYSRSRLHLYERMRARILAGRSEEEFLESGERIGPYLTLMRGRSFEKENLRWMEKVLMILSARGKGPRLAAVTAMDGHRDRQRSAKAKADQRH